MGGLARSASGHCLAWFRAHSHLSLLFSVVELTVTEDSLSNAPSEKSSQIRYLSSWKTLGIQTILLYLLMDCRRSTVGLCLGRLLESPGFSCRHPSRYCWVASASSQLWSTSNPTRNWLSSLLGLGISVLVRVDYENRTEGVHAIWMPDLRCATSSRLFRAKTRRTIVVDGDQQLPGQHASNHGPSLG